MSHHFTANYHTVLILLSLFSHTIAHTALTVPTLFSHCSITVLYHCSHTVLTLFPHCSITVLSLFSYCSHTVPTLFYHCSITVLSLFSHFSHIVLTQNVFFNGDNENELTVISDWESRAHFETFIESEDRKAITARFIHCLEKPADHKVLLFNPEYTPTL